MSPRPRRLQELGSFDPHIISLVRDSCRRLPPNAQALTHEFYCALFSMAPDVRSMFPVDMSQQQEKLLRAIVAAVNALDDPGSLEPQLRAWGAWHRRVLGVSDEMYVYVGHALVRALRQVIGHTETSVGSAWIAVYEWIAAVMIDGADEIDAAAQAASAQGPPPLSPGEPAYDEAQVFPSVR